MGMLRAIERRGKTFYGYASCYREKRLSLVQYNSFDKDLKKAKPFYMPKINGSPVGNYLKVYTLNQAKKIIEDKLKGE